MGIPLRVGVGLLLLLIACDPGPPRADGRSSSPTGNAVRQSSNGPHGCEGIGQEDFHLKVSPDSATQSSWLRVTGAVARRGEDGSYMPPDDNEAAHFWFDLGIERWLEVVERGPAPEKDPEGDVLYLGQRRLTDAERCRFRFAFEVPDVAPGRYKVLPVVFGTEAAAPYDDATIEVVPPPDCGRTSITSDAYGTEIHPTTGPPGSVVTLSGTTLRGEDGRWAASDRLEAWWGSTTPSDGIRLTRVDDMERCRFHSTFVVPDADPGHYEISVFVWGANPRDGYGLFLSHHFTVT